jgi:hypothetical protein
MEEQATLSRAEDFYLLSPFENGTGAMELAVSTKNMNVMTLTCSGLGQKKQLMSHVGKIRLEFDVRNHCGKSDQKD